METVTMECARITDGRPQSAREINDMETTRQNRAESAQKCLDESNEKKRLKEREWEDGWRVGYIYIYIYI